MGKATIRQASLRNRLILGVSLMLFPLLGLAGGAYVSFEQAVASFEKSESKRLEELFPIDRLEESLMKTASLVDGQNSYDTLERQSRFTRLSQEIEQTFTFLLNSPSQVVEKRRLILELQKEWQQVYVNANSLLMHSGSVAEERQQRQQLEKHLSTASQEIRRLNVLLTSFQSSDNLRQAQEIKKRVRTINLLTATVVIFMAIRSIFFLANSILRPLKQLKQGVAQFGDGDLSFRIDLKSGDELEQLANTINWMAENLEQNQRELTEMATIDGLTGVFNRREFNRRLTIEIERSLREGHPVSLLMVDIDYFKKINDLYGHQSGDDALRHISGLIKREVRPGDLPARYGGEEFAVILPYANGTEAFAVAERLRTLIEDQEITIQDNQKIKVTASLGCATFLADAQTETVLMAAADAALYRAKESGRNQVCMAGSSFHVENTPVANEAA
jgi:two-component system, cell cycle response regulator